jgi:hypothetical protein
MPTLDVFSGDAFSLRSLTAAILKAPYKPGRLGEMGHFSESGITTTTAQVEEQDGQLSLIPTSPRGGPSDTLGTSARRMRAFSVPHLQRESTIVADEVQGVRAFGSESDTQTVQGLVDQRLATLRQMHEVTLEHLRIGALKGLIKDADGSTTIYNLFTEFGVSQQTQDFNFTTTTLDVRDVCVAVLRAMEDELGGSTYSGAHAFCSPGWFDALIGHKAVKDSFKYQEGQVLRSDLRRGFTFGGITFEEYRGSVGGIDFIEANVAYCFPEGAQTVKGPLFQTWFAPADFEETVNTLGLPIYAKQARDQEFQRWVKLHSQSNPLPICLRPRSVIKLTKS